MTNEDKAAVVEALDEILDGSRVDEIIGFEISYEDLLWLTQLGREDIKKSARRVKREKHLGVGETRH